MLAWLLMIISGLAVQDVEAVDVGRQAFESRCAGCHGADGNGGDIGPPIGLRLPAYNDQELGSLIRNGLPARGMPASRVPSSEMASLLSFLRTIQHRGAGNLMSGRKLQIQTTEGQTIEGQALGAGFE